MSEVSSALEAWAAALGSDHVIADREQIIAAEQATYPTDHGVLARIRPGSAVEVLACLRIAGEHRVPVYPASRGRNWGFGSRVPSADGCVLLELDRMSAISGLDEELAHVTIEPGVTQRQLQEFLAQHSGRLWMDATSSSPHASLIGNLMERGHGVSPYGDRVANVAGLEVALPSGELIRTGYGAFSGSESAALDPWGVGPSLDGLFTQSSFGVVTRATFWLMPIPEHVEVCFFNVSTDEQLERLVDGVRPLRMHRVLKAGPFLSNVYQSLQKVSSYPWDRTGGETPLGEKVALELAQAFAFNRWNGSIGLYGSKAEVAEQKVRLLAVLEACGATSRIVDRELGGIDAFPPARRSEVTNVVAGFTGRAGAASLPQGYWRKRGLELKGDVDLDRDRCGFKFCSVTLPFRGRDVLRLSALTVEHILSFGFEPVLGMLPIRERVLHCQIATAYDRDCSGDEAQILPCYESLSEKLAELGYLPARLGVGATSILARRDAAYNSVLERLKSVFDPHHILAPGRYMKGS
jgi:4-cresol dehydrogenase (hydroxylating)